MAQTERIDLGALQTALEKANNRAAAATSKRTAAEAAETLALTAQRKAKDELDGAYRAITRTV